STSSPPFLYPLSLHDALPIFAPVTATWPATLSLSRGSVTVWNVNATLEFWARENRSRGTPSGASSTRYSDPASACVISRALVRRSEEHTSELQSHLNLVCRLL